MAPPSGPPTGPPLTRPPLPGQQPLTNGPNMPTYSAPPLGPPLPSNVQQNYPPMSQEHFSTQQQQLSGPPLGPPQGPPQSYQQQPPLGPPPMTQPGLNRPPLSQQQPIQLNGPSYQQQPQQQQQQLINQFQSNMNISQPNNRQNTNMPPPIQQQQQQQSHVTQNMILNQNRSQPQAIDLQRERRLLMPYAEDTPPRPIFPQEFYNNVNCHYE